MFVAIMSSFNDNRYSYGFPLELFLKFGRDELKECLGSPVAPGVNAYESDLSTTGLVLGFLCRATHVLVTFPPFTLLTF